MSEEPDLRPEFDVLQLERDVGARPGLFLKLLREDDDWTFVIKTHALVEAAVTHLLTETCGVRALERHFARLELSGATLGKVAIAKDLEVLDSSERAQVRKLSELRNQLVHDVANTDFAFERWVKSLDRNQLNEFATAFSGTNVWTIGEHTYPPGEVLSAESAPLHLVRVPVSPFVDLSPQGVGQVQELVSRRGVREGHGVREIASRRT